MYNAECTMTTMYFTNYNYVFTKADNVEKIRKSRYSKPKTPMVPHNYGECKLITASIRHPASTKWHGCCVVVVFLSC